MKKTVLTAICVLIALSISGESNSEAGAPPPSGMALIPAGTFFRGSDLYQKDEQPAKKIHVGAFYIDITEVKHIDYLMCVRSGKCRKQHFGKAAGRGFPSPQPDWPAVGIDWFDADAYCKWKNKRLPTEAEWEKAARGDSVNPYPWGDTADCEHMNYFKCSINHPVKVGSYPKGQSQYGMLDMSGNAQEWVADWYDKNYYSVAPDKDPQGPASGTKRVLRGGSYDYTYSSTRVSFRFNDYPENFDNGYGIRCAATP